MTETEVALALFEVTPGGEFVIPAADPVEVPASVDPIEEAKAAWLEGRTEPVHPMDLAAAVILPDSIDLTTRAFHLAEALSAIGLANADKGYGKAATAGAGTYVRAKVEADAGLHTDDKAAELAGRSVAGIKLARLEFFRANGIGHLAMRTGEQMTPTEHLARVSVERQWGDFQTAYGGVGKVVRTRRAALKATLTNQMAYTTPEEN